MWASEDRQKPHLGVLSLHGHVAEGHRLLRSEIMALIRLSMIRIRFGYQYGYVVCPVNSHSLCLSCILPLFSEAPAVQTPPWYLLKESLPYFPSAFPLTCSPCRPCAILSSLFFGFVPFLFSSRRCKSTPYFDRRFDGLISLRILHRSSCCRYAAASCVQSRRTSTVNSWWLPSRRSTTLAALPTLLKGWWSRSYAMLSAIPLATR